MESTQALLSFKNFKPRIRFRYLHNYFLFNSLSSIYNNIINILIKEKKCHGKKILKKNGYIGKKRYQGKLYNKYRKMDMQLPLFFIKSFLYINI